MEREVKEAKIRNLLTPFTNILACHTLNKDIPEDLWNAANESMIRILDLIKDETKGTVEVKTVTSTSHERPKQRDLLKKYFNKEQLEFVKKGLELSHPQKYDVSDIKFVEEDGLPEEKKSCIAFYPNNMLSIGSNLSYYQKGNWWYFPVHDGSFGSPLILPRDIFAYIILK